MLSSNLLMFKMMLVALLFVLVALLLAWCVHCVMFLVVTFKKLDGPLNSGVSRKRKKPGAG
jgi:hypothetical protein